MIGGTKAINPEYMEWDLERLQHEYFRVVTTRNSLVIQVSDLKNRERIIQDFLEAFRALEDLDEAKM